MNNGTFDNTVRALDELGKYLTNPENRQEIDFICDHAKHKNGWFSADDCRDALHAIVARFLNAEEILSWAKNYPDLPCAAPAKVGLILAGNVPLVGWADIQYTLLCGHRLLIKLSSQDEVLPAFLLNKLIMIEPALSQLITLVDTLKDYDAVIATGSDNTNKYFEYYFRDKPRLLRGTRKSIAILSGEETPEQISMLAGDMFSYYGLGCRNVSHLLVPEGWDTTRFLDNLESQRGKASNHKYANNYLYYKSIYLLNKEPHLDNGFALFKNDDALLNPISVYGYSFYRNRDELRNWLASRRDKLQVAVTDEDTSDLPQDIPYIKIGQAQQPGMCDYADNVDTTQFLLDLCKS